MKEKYTLYLDETKFKDRETGKHLYAVAGIIVPEEIIPAVEKAVLDVKKRVWPKKSDYSGVILHEAEIRSNNRRVLERRPEYVALIDSDGNKAKLIKGIGEVINRFDLTILGTVIDQTSIQNTYNIQFENNVYNSYKMALAKLIENFMLFLKIHDGVGEIIFESRQSGTQDVEDKRVKKAYYKVLAHGTLMYEGIEIQERIEGIHFLGKYENNQLLQIADFIPRPITLAYAHVNQSKPSIYKTSIRKQRFTAYQMDGASKFGVCVIK